jgi:hypothetical protein
MASAVPALFSSTRHARSRYRTPSRRVPGRGFAAHLRPEPHRPGIRLTLMTASRRLATTVAAVTVLVALTASCASVTSAHRATAPAKSAPAAASFSVMGLAFRYPVSWQRSRTWSSDLPGSSALTVYLSSTSRLRAPCVASSSPGRIAQTCEYPVRVLPPAGILVRWSANGFPAWRTPKANTTIAGRKATETRTSGGWCAPLRATETITVIIARATPGHWYQMDACLRAPGLPQQQAQISSMLRSVRIAKGG